MNKTELTEKLAKQTGMTKADAKRAVDAIFSTAPREGIIASLFCWRNSGGCLC